MSFAFQKTVGLYNEPATVGDRASQNPTVYLPVNFLAGGTINVGSFVWRDTTNPGTEVVAAGSGMPLGFVERTINHDNFDIDVAGTLAIPEEGNVTVAQRGDFYVVSDGAVSIGDTVYAKTASGEPTFSSSSAVETGYVAVTAAAGAGELVVISNWFDRVTITGTGSGTLSGTLSGTGTGSMSGEGSGTFSGTVTVDGDTGDATGTLTGTVTISTASGTISVPASGTCSGTVTVS